MMDYTRNDRLVAQEIASAMKAGKTITGLKIAAITGLTEKEVCVSLRRLAEADLIQAYGP